jgi:hypothetical protein
MFTPEACEFTQRLTTGEYRKGRETLYTSTNILLQAKPKHQQMMKEAEEKKCYQSLTYH